MTDVLKVFDLTGRAAVVTGGGSGIGRATAQVLAGAGASVVVGDIVEEGANETARLIAEAGGTAVAHLVDVTSREEVDDLVRRSVKEYGRLDAMANVAGVASDGMLMDTSEEQLDRAFGINLKGVFFGCQSAVRAMIDSGNGGSIVNVSSTAIDQPAKGYGVYAMTKASVAMLTKTLALEVGKHGIRVNTIAPGFTVTPFTSRHLYREDGTVNQEKYDAFVEQMKKLSPLRRVGEPEDQAYLILYLMSDAAKFSTGTIWRANGGQAMF
ncbi:MAG: SDR family oxidoreductase [Actinobacteria bacterium]|nr:SDR family oxidoreductase [Actinomycetota bacterium]